MIYFDNAATTCVTDEVMQVFLRYLQDEYANISSKHIFASNIEKKVKAATKAIAKHLNVSADNVLFTSGATESNNMAIFSVTQRFPKAHLITTKIEHPSVLEVFKVLENKGFDVNYLDVDKSGLIDLEQLRSLIKENTKLISIMYVNNEIGSIQPIAEISKMLAQMDYKGFFHSDATQALGKFDCDMKRLGVDVLSASGHKLHAPKGIGLLAFQEGFSVRPLLFGGAQQRGLRSGTMNSSAIAAFAKAIDLAVAHRQSNYDRMIEFRKKLHGFAEKHKDICKLIGEMNATHSPYVNSLVFKNIKSEVILHSLEQRGIMVASSSACSSKSAALSHVLDALNDKDVENGAIRVSFSHLNTEEEVDQFLISLEQIIMDLVKFFK